MSAKGTYLKIVLKKGSLPYIPIGMDGHVSQTVLQWINWIAGAIILCFGLWALSKAIH